MIIRTELTTFQTRSVHVNLAAPPLLVAQRRDVGEHVDVLEDTGTGWRAPYPTTRVQTCTVLMLPLEGVTRPSSAVGQQWHHRLAITDIVCFVLISSLPLRYKARLGYAKPRR